MARARVFGALLFTRLLKGLGDEGSTDDVTARDRPERLRPPLLPPPLPKGGAGVGEATADAAPGGDTVLVEEEVPPRAGAGAGAGTPEPGGMRSRLASRLASRLTSRLLSRIGEEEGRKLPLLVLRASLPPVPGLASASAPGAGIFGIMIFDESFLSKRFCARTSS